VHELVFSAKFFFLLRSPPGAAHSIPRVNETVRPGGEASFFLSFLHTLSFFHAGFPADTKKSALVIWRALPPLLYPSPNPSPHRPQYRTRSSLSPPPHPFFFPFPFFLVGAKRSMRPRTDRDPFFFLAPSFSFPLTDTCGEGAERLPSPSSLVFPPPFGMCNRDWADEKRRDSHLSLSS